MNKAKIISHTNFITSENARKVYAKKEVSEDDEK